MALALPSEVPQKNEYAIFSKKYSITSYSVDPLHWNKDWDKLLHKLTANEVYSLLSLELKKENWKQNFLAAKTTKLRDEVRKVQIQFMKFWSDMEKRGHFLPAWLLLEENGRRTHLMNGLEDACKRSMWGQDARALCPEIRISSMQKQAGKAYTAFVGSFCKTNFLMYSGMSMLRDLAQGGNGMDPVIDIIKAWPGTSISRTLNDMNGKPTIRCENCTKSPEEIGGDVKFMLCSSCKKKLNFSVHYCSQACQKEDWPKHKPYCGVEKVTKELRGTTRDPFWRFPNTPEHLRSSNLKFTNGNVAISDMGFGELDPSRSYSQALRRQVSLINEHKVADYFLFNEANEPRPLLKMAFRMLRADAIFGSEQKGMEALGEYLIKMMHQEPGLSRERILAQLTEEYGGNVAAKVKRFEATTISKGYEKGTTFVDIMGKSLAASMPTFINMTTDSKKK